MRAAAVQDKREQDDALEYDGDGLVTKLLNGVQPIAQQAGVGRQDHQEKAGHQEAGQSDRVQHGGQQHEAERGHEQPD